MYEMFIDDENRPMAERKAYMVLEHCVEARSMPVSEILRYSEDLDGKHVVFSSNGVRYSVTCDRHFLSAEIEKKVPEAGHKTPVRHTHSERYNRLSAVLFPTL